MRKEILMRKKRKEKKEIDKGQEKKGKNIQEFFKRSLQELKRKKNYLYRD